MNQLVIVFPRTPAGMEALEVFKVKLAALDLKLNDLSHSPFSVPEQELWLSFQVSSHEEETADIIKTLLQLVQDVSIEDLQFPPYLQIIRRGMQSYYKLDTHDQPASEDVVTLDNEPKFHFRDSSKRNNRPQMVILTNPRPRGDGGNPMAPAPVARLLQGRLPERVSLNKALLLEARIAAQDDADLETPSVPVVLPPEGGTVKISVHAPGFVSPPDEELVKILHVPAQGSSVWLPFELVAQRPGKQKIEVSGYFGNAYLGTLTLEVQVGSGSVNGPGRISTLPVTMRQREPGEVNLEIRRTGETYTFRVVENNFSLDDWQSPPMARSSQVAVEGLIAQLNKMAQGQSGLAFSDANTSRQWLRGQGILLWNEFVPRPLQEFFWKRRNDIKRMTIVSKDDAVPWELLYPLGPDNADEGFLQETTELARWTFGAPPPSRLTLRHPRFVSPQGGPASTASEVERLHAIFPDAAPPIDTLSSLLGELQDGAFDLLHFACHNRFVPQQAADSFIEMDNRQQFSPVFLAGIPSWQPRTPLVFFNACRSAGEGASYTRAAGWASCFLAAGAGAFLGSLWEVRDTSAATFAEAFYGTLRDGETVGAALKAGRNAIKGCSGDPTWLAYAFYGDPAATLEVN